MSEIRHQGVLVLGEQRDGRLRQVTFELLNIGRQLADKLGVELSCAVLGDNIVSLEEILARGAHRVYYLRHKSLAQFLPGPYARALIRLIQETRPEIMVAAATTTGRTVMPLVAAGVATGLTADCTELDIDPETGLLLQTRPAIGGNIMATIKTPDTRPQMATVRPRAFAPAQSRQDGGGEVVEVQPAEDTFNLMEKFLAFIPDLTQEVNIQEADIIVTGGSGMKSPEGFGLVEELARELGAAVGATRAAVELGWATYPHQIGLSGKVVAPKLYIALGVAGQIQHLAGMQTSGVVVAVNEDPEAQIFRVADFGIVGDVLEVVPELIRAVREIKSARGEVRS
ncbi:MAG: electron transfer flavoprotein subunit alpha/FixB family protein [Bacillota bacterium]